jgi:hypothetical protein
VPKERLAAAQGAVWRSISVMIICWITLRPYALASTPGSSRDLPTLHHYYLFLFVIVPLNLSVDLSVHFHSSLLFVSPIATLYLFFVIVS